MKAVIRLDVPDWQIGQEVKVYFPDTMCVRGTCEDEVNSYTYELGFLEGVKQAVKKINTCEPILLDTREQYRRTNYD